MVNNRNLSAYAGTPPEREGASRVIKGGPLYSPEVVLAVLARGPSALSLWTRKCISDTKRFDMGMDQIAQLVEHAVRHGAFKGSQWCASGTAGAWAACDSYQVFWRKWMPAAHKELTIEYYVKFAVAKSGQLLLLVSCHPPEDR